MRQSVLECIFENEKACYVGLASLTSADNRTSKTATAQLLRKHWELQKCSDIPEDKQPKVFLYVNLDRF